MNKFNLIVLTPSLKDPTEVFSYVDLVLSQYDHTLLTGVQPCYLPQTEVTRIAQFYHLPEDNLVEISLKLFDWCGHVGDFDERGVYIFQDGLTESKFQSYLRVKNPCLLRDIPKETLNTCFDFIGLDKQWVEFHLASDLDDKNTFIQLNKDTLCQVVNCFL